MAGRSDFKIILNQSEGDVVQILRVVEEAEKELSDVYAAAMNAFGPLPLTTAPEEYGELCVKRLLVLSHVDPEEARTFSSFLAYYGIRQEDPRLQQALKTLTRDSLASVTLGSPPRHGEKEPLASENSTCSMTPLGPRNLSYSSCDTHGKVPIKLEEAIPVVTANFFSEKDQSFMFEMMQRDIGQLWDFTVLVGFLDFGGSKAWSEEIDSRLDNLLAQLKFKEDDVIALKDHGRLTAEQSAHLSRCLSAQVEFVKMRKEVQSHFRGAQFEGAFLACARTISSKSIKKPYYRVVFQHCQMRQILLDDTRGVVAEPLLNNGWLVLNLANSHLDALTAHWSDKQSTEIFRLRMQGTYRVEHFDLYGVGATPRAPSSLPSWRFSLAPAAIVSLMNQEGMSHATMTQWILALMNFILEMEKLTLPQDLQGQIALWVTRFP